MKYAIYILFTILCTSCTPSELNSQSDSIGEEKSVNKQNPYLVVLGNVQDAGYPQIGCMKACCKEHWSAEAKKKMIMVTDKTDQKVE